MMVVAGVAEVFKAFQIKSWSKFLLWGLLGVLYILAGFVTFEKPQLAWALLTLILGASLLASGVMRIILAFSMKWERPWLWVALSGAIKAIARRADFAVLADLQPLHPRSLSQHRSHHGRRGLDRTRHWPATQSVR
jgi:hypothetical protein